MFFNFDLLLHYLDVPNARRYVNNLLGVSFDEDEMKIILPIIKEKYNSFKNNIDLLFVELKDKTENKTHAKIDLAKERLNSLFKFK